MIASIGNALVSKKSSYDLLWLCGALANAPHSIRCRLVRIERRTRCFNPCLTRHWQ